MNWTSTFDDSLQEGLRKRLGGNAQVSLRVVGNQLILKQRLFGLICSIKSPGSVILKTFDAIRELRDVGITLIAGFHSPVEKDCLDILLRGDQHVVLCAAKGLRGLRIGGTARKAVKDERLLLLSPFSDDVRRTTAAQAVQRNKLIAELANDIFVPHASPGGKTEALCREITAKGKSLYTIDSVDNANLLDMGAVRLEINNLKHLVD